MITINHPALRYHGGKFRLASWIISHFPEHNCYVEPYGGAASVLLQKQSATHEVYNDLDGYVVGFFRVLREQPEALIEAIRWTPYSRREFREAWDDKGEAGTLEAARRLFVRASQSFGNGIAQAAASVSWRFSKSAQSDRNRDGRSPVKTWNQIDHLYAIAERLKRVHIECDDAVSVMTRFDTPATLFYVDPPYVTSTRERAEADYAFEMTDDDHVKLASALEALSGHIVLSGYDSELYSDLYSRWKKVVRATLTGHGSKRTECLWLSPNMPMRQTSMFGEAVLK